MERMKTDIMKREWTYADGGVVAGEELICVVCDPGDWAEFDSGERAECDRIGRVVSAAPDLLAACQAAKEWDSYGEGQGSEGHGDYTRLRRALQRLGFDADDPKAFVRSFVRGLVNNAIRKATGGEVGS